MTAILDILQRRQQDWATLAKSDAGAAGHFARGFVVVNKNVAMYANENPEPARVDEATMTSWWTISTHAIDREGDSILPSGCLKTIANYKKNPVVSLDHFRDEPLPVGVSIGDNKLPLIVGVNDIRAGCKHHDLTKMARDVWTLTKAGILRGASIAFFPLKAKQVGEVNKGSLKSARFVIEEYDVNEWAITPRPMNPQAIRIELSRGTIESDEFKKSLADFAEKPAIYSHGWTPEDDAMSKTVNFRDIQSIRFAKSAFDQEKAQDFLKAIGGDGSMVVENDTSLDFVQQPGEHKESVKLGKGVQGLLLKSVAAPVVGAVEKTLAIDETPDEVPAVVAKAADAPPEKKPTDAKAKPKGPVRTTLAAQDCGDVMNHMAGFKQHLAQGMSIHDHDPTVELFQKLSDMTDEMVELMRGHTDEHFDGVDMNKVANDRAAAKEEEGGDAKEKDKQKKKALDDAVAHDAASLEKLQALLDKRAPALDSIAKSLDAAKANQEAIKVKFKLVG